jgi:hypothetical protein
VKRGDSYTRLLCTLCFLGIWRGLGPYNIHLMKGTKFRYKCKLVQETEKEKIGLGTKFR